MTDHSACRKAYPERRAADRRWVWDCVACGRRLASFTFADGSTGLVFADGLVLLDGTHDGLRRYGLPARVLTGHSAKGVGTPAPTRRLPVFVYCPTAVPGRARCGAGQHLEGPPDS